MTTTGNKILAWNGETYTGAGMLFDYIDKHEDFENLDHDEKLRLAIYGYNQNALPKELFELLESEQENYEGENTSEEEFARELMEPLLINWELPDWVVIDYAATWQSALRFDYFTYRVIDIDGDYRQFFWRAY